MDTSNLMLFPVSGNIKISTPNSNLDGTGAISEVLKSGKDGTFLRTLTIKAEGPTSQGMIRVFIGKSAKYFLLFEIKVPAKVNSGVVRSFISRNTLSYILEAGYSLGVSTEIGDTFSIIVDGTSFKNCGCPQIES